MDTHLPVLSTRFAAERPQAIAKNQGITVSDLIRDEIDRRVTTLLAELVPANA